MKFITMTSIAALAIAGTAYAQDAESLNAAELESVEQGTDAPAADVYAQEKTYGDTAQSDVGMDVETTEDAYGEGVYGADTAQMDDAIETPVDELGTSDYSETYDAQPDEYASEPEDLTMAESGPIMDTTPLAEDDAIAQARDEFAQADTDGDGQLSRDEFLATMTVLASNERPVDPMADPMVGDADEFGAEMDEQNEFETADVTTEASAQDPSEYLVAKFTEIAGDDDAVTLDELEEDRREDFEAADADGDGELEGEEAQAFAQLKTGQDVAQTSTY